METTFLRGKTRFFFSALVFSQMSIFMSQGLWEMLPRVTRGQSLLSHIPGELSMSARGQCFAGRTQSLLSLHSVACPLQWKKILCSALFHKMSTEDEQRTFLYILWYKNRCRLIQNKTKARIMQVVFEILRSQIEYSQI